MARSNGCDVARQVKEAGYTVPMVAVSGNTMGSDIVMYKDAGFSGSLGKPLTAHELRDCTVAVMSGGAYWPSQ